MTLRVAQAKPRLLKPEARKQHQKSFRCAVTISSKVSKKAVTRNHLRRTLHDHLRSRFEKMNDYSKHWVLISLKPSASIAKKNHLLKECDNLFHKAGLVK